MNDSHKYLQNLMDYVQLEVRAKSIEFKHDPVTNFSVDLEDLRSVTYFLSTIQLPTKDSIFSELKYLSEESISLEDLKKNIEEQINALSTMTGNIESYKKFLTSNIPMFTRYFYNLCDPNNENLDEKTLKAHKLFFLKEMKELSFQITSIYDKNNQLVHYRNSPTQSIQLLVGANPPFLQEVICNIEQCISDPIFAKYKKTLNAAKSLCENIANEVTLAFISSKDHYSKADFANLVSFRNQLKEFISFTGHIDYTAKTNLSQTCSVFLYHLDNILFALCFLTPQKVTNLIDVSSTAIEMTNLIKDIKIGDEILTFLNTIYMAYKSNFMIQGTNQELLKFLDLLTEDFERKVTLPSILENPSKGYFLSVLFSKLCLNVSKIEFDQGIFDIKEVIFDITSLLTILDKLQTLKPKSKYRINEYEKYFINNSKTAKSLQTNNEESEFSFKKLETINLDEINLDDENKIKEIYELIKKSFPFVENNNKLNDFLVKTKKFNKIVKEMNIRANKMTPDYSQSNLLNGICFILDLSFAEALEISKFDDNLLSFVKKLDSMVKFYDKMKQKVTYPSISIYTKQMKEDIEFLSSKVTFDDKYRECNLSIHFETLIELLSKFVSLIGMNQTEKTNIKFVIDCLEKVTVDLSLLYQSFTIEDENFILYGQFVCEMSSYFNTISQNLHSKSNLDVSLIKGISNLLGKLEDLLSLFMTNKSLFTKYCGFLSDVSKVIYSIS
ncbi:hypothetical protein TVAG_111450 [Trichomonas vaginalis G3]|uniref:Uncharacterized protein n=1 Tax=Trichomonas vaginalis (strain ATCC PRA-98 / G3) TaxID=412133 RepID=A2F004_TRIV3|nr:hypothetical protein TVAGG3_0144640 [Trichomonas vaginalis G3]EAY01788.1 hypothetical protein TVAG_111450 [Trichomonas vaginalis G3]KAI5546830.1 hypothetical protein TVAGG3_0144640 [Trichomonas vaginalis G3]|eukprot:XP_001314346.1 hypothetical protein [Trichomonas vaginalis G3]